MKTPHPPSLREGTFFHEGRRKKMPLRPKLFHVALGLLMFGFIVTFGSTVMGSAIMATGRRETEQDGQRGGGGWWHKKSDRAADEFAALVSHGKGIKSH
jgi:hypothetical protein